MIAQMPANTFFAEHHCSRGNDGVSNSGSMRLRVPMQLPTNVSNYANVAGP